MSSAPIYFRFFIDDWLRDCEELSHAQAGAYLKLMIWYYSRAKPIPNDMQRIYSRTRSMSREDQSAIDFVLTEFFRLDGNCWRQKKCEEEIKDWSKRTTAARDNAKARWTKEKAKENKEIYDADALRRQYGGNANQNQNQNQNRVEVVQEGYSLSKGLEVDRSPENRSSVDKIPQAKVKIKIPANYHTSPAACDSIAHDLGLPPRGPQETREQFANRIIDAVEKYHANVAS